MVARRAIGIAASTIAFHRKRLENFITFCEGRGVHSVDRVDATLIREWLLGLENRQNPGGIRGYFITVKAFWNWYEDEIDDPEFRNPIRKITTPKVPDKLMPSVEVADFQAIIDACHGDREALRDKAILLTLFDSGVRAGELTALNVGDFDTVTGALIVQRGKGGKYRTVFTGQKTRRAIRAYLKERGNVGPDEPLFATRNKTRILYMGLRSLVTRRAAQPGA